MFGWTAVDRGIDVLTPITQPENAVYIALDTFFCVTLLLVTFVSTILDTKLLLFAMRTQVEVERSFQDTEDRSTSSNLEYRRYEASLSRALNEMFLSFITTLFDND